MPAQTNKDDRSGGDQQYEYSKMQLATTALEVIDLCQTDPKVVYAQLIGNIMY